MAAELETDQVVLLIVGGRAAHPVLAHLTDLQLGRIAGRGPDRPRPALDADGLADVGLRDLRVDHAWCTNRVRPKDRAMAGRKAERRNGEQDGCRENERCAHTSSVRRPRAPHKTLLWTRPKATRSRAVPRVGRAPAPRSAGRAPASGPGCGRSPPATSDPDRRPSRTGASRPCAPG